MRALAVKLFRLVFRYPRPEIVFPQPHDTRDLVTEVRVASEDSSRFQLLVLSRDHRWYVQTLVGRPRVFDDVVFDCDDSFLPQVREAVRGWAKLGSDGPHPGGSYLIVAALGGHLRQLRYDNLPWWVTTSKPLHLYRQPVQ